MSASLRAGRYGIDAPYAPLGMLAGAVACAAVAVFVAPQWWVSAIILTLMAGLYLHTTRRGKFLVWQRLLAAQPWRGDERVLDLGCGRGMVLLDVARHLPRGRAVGVDIWSSKDQSGNAMAAALANAEAEGVAARVELHTADMRRLPFANASFDAVVSNVAIHNIATREGRAQAIDEAWRVLRPGGVLLLADINKTDDYVARLATHGVTATRRSLGWRMWWGGPWVPTRVVEVRKPAAVRVPG